MTSVDPQRDAMENATEIQNFLVEVKIWETEIKDQETKIKQILPKPAESFGAPRNVPKKNLPGPSKVKATPKKLEADDEFVESEEGTSSALADKIPTKKSAPESAGGVHTEESGASASKSVASSGDIPTKESVGDVTPEKLQAIDAAHFEKELGNQFVKKGEWSEAAACYTKAIKLDQSNPIFHSNRALCYLKLSKFKLAEVDSTIAIQLDGSYSKAYQRRGLARKALNQYNEAKADFLQLLTLEPNNVSAQTELAQIDEYLAKLAENPKKSTEPTFDPKKMFEESKKTLKKAETFDPKKIFGGGGAEKKKEVAKKTESAVGSKDLRQCRKDTAKSRVPVIPDCCGDALFGPPPEGSIPVESITKPPHLRSKTPMKSIKIKTEATPKFDELVTSMADLQVEKTKAKAKPTADVSPKSAKPETSSAVSSSANPGSASSVAQEISLPPVPNTYVQFDMGWKMVRRSPSHAYKYLKAFPCEKMSAIFGSSLESATMSELLALLAQEQCQQDSPFLFQFIKNLSTVERFSSLVLFATPDDEKAIKLCLKTLDATQSKEEMSLLREKYCQ